MAFSIKPSMGLQAHPGLLPDLFQDDWLAAANVHESFMHQPVESSGLEISRMSHGSLFNLSHGNLYLMGASHEEEQTELDFNLDPDPLISLDAEMERFITSMEAVAPVDHLQARCDLLQDRCPDRSSGETQRDGGSSSGGAQSTDTVDTEDHEIRKQQALERNARAQKKFRERQKARLVHPALYKSARFREPAAWLGVSRKSCYAYPYFPTVLRLPCCLDQLHFIRSNIPLPAPCRLSPSFCDTCA